MKQKTKNPRILWMALVIAVIIGGCSAPRTARKTPAASSNEKNMKRDYLAEGTVLATFYAEDGGFSETRYYPANIVQQASEQTNGEYQVAAIIGDFEVKKGSIKWTGDVIMKSHPAAKKELKKGMTVLYTTKPAEEGLEEARWNRGVVASTNELYKEVVLIDHVWHLERPDEGDRQKSIPLENIRIIDEPEREQ